MEQISVERILEQITWNKPAFIDINYSLSFESWMLQAYCFSQFLIEEEKVLSGDIIVVSVEVTIALPCIMLGIFLAKATYVLVDVETSDAELIKKINFLKSTLCITEGRDSSLFPVKNLNIKEHSESIFCFNKAPKVSAQSVLESAFERLKNDTQVLYVLFTSGTSSDPKGVCINAKNIFFIVSGYVHELELDAKESVLALTSVSFDISQMDFWVPFFSGGTTHLLSNSNRKNPKYIAEYISQNNITFIQATPTVWQEIIYFLDQICCHPKNLKLISAGEALPTNLAKKMMLKGQVYNVYGPTETTIYATTAKIKASDLSVSVPIGRALPEVKTRVVNKNFSEVGPGYKGELLIGGVGVSNGYFNNDVKTQYAYIYLEINGVKERFYRTGDIASLSEDGDLYYHGRSDDQIKVSGVRMNLSDIDNIIMSFEKISDCKSVYLKTDRLVLIFYTETEDGFVKTNISEIKKALHQELGCSFSVKFFKKNTMPKSISGKTAKDLLLSEYESENIRRVTLTEKSQNILNKIEEEFFELHKDFFINGVNSVELIRLQYLIQERLRVDIPLHKFFEYKKIEDLLSDIQLRFNKQNDSQTNEKIASPLVDLREKRKKSQQRKRLVVKGEV